MTNPPPQSTDQDDLSEGVPHSRPARQPLLSPLLGCAIGDALGKSFENYLQPLAPGAVIWDGKTMVGGFRVPIAGMAPEVSELLAKPGVHTDDTQMCRVLARSLVVNRGTYDVAYVRRAYQKWADGQSFVGAPRGIGGTVKASLESRPLPNALDPYKVCGAGALVRGAILGVGVRGDLLEAVKQDAYLTHIHPESVPSAYVMASAARWFARRPVPRLQGFFERCTKDLKDYGYGHTATAWAVATLGAVYDNYAYYGDTEEMDPVGGLFLGNDTVGLMAGALYATFTANSFGEGARFAVFAAGDTDTRAAMAGTLLGLRFGRKGLPKQWLKVLYEREAIENEDNDLMGYTLPF